MLLALIVVGTAIAIGLVVLAVRSWRYEREWREMRRAHAYSRALDAPGTADVSLWLAALTATGSSGCDTSSSPDSCDN